IRRPSGPNRVVRYMKQSLDLRLGQHLTITPQLQQAIRLLQLSSAELQQEIQEALESNPLLEERELGEAEGETKGDTHDAPAENGEPGGDEPPSNSEDFAATDTTM